MAKKRKIDDKEIMKIVQAYKSGFGINSLGKIFNNDTSTIRWWLKRYNVYERGRYPTKTIDKFPGFIRKKIAIIKPPVRVMPPYIPKPADRWDEGYRPIKTYIEYIDQTSMLNDYEKKITIENYKFFRNHYQNNISHLWL